MKLPFQLDRYTLTELIGAGAFGRVYRAEVRGDMGFVSDFAVKVLDSAVVADNPNVARQMADEARILAQLDHPNIVKVIDFKHVDHDVIGDIYFMVLEFVRGVDISEVLETFVEEGRHLPATAVLHMGLMVADALAHAHALLGRDGTSLGLVHRDLKPQNLMVNFRGQVKVLDFGIAKAKDNRLAARTQEGQTKGTVFYMSPEQLTGEDLDSRADLYSLGAILYEMLLGRRLLDVEVMTPADLARAMHTAFEMDIEERLEPLRLHLEAGHNGELPEEAVDGWIGLLRATLQKDRRYRPDSARIFSEQLEWLRARHPAAENRNFWSSVVEQESGYHSLPPQGKPPVIAEDVPMDLSVAASPATGEFFGLDGGSSFEDLPLPSPGVHPPDVPVTRAMSAVTGQVRAFGSDAVQRLGPGLESPSLPPHQQPLQPLHPSGPHSSPKPTYAQTLDTPAHSPDVEEITEVFDGAVPPPPVISARRTPARGKSGPDRNVLAGVAIGLALLLGVLAVIVFGRPAANDVVPPEEPAIAEGANVVVEPPPEPSPAPVEEPVEEPTAAAEPAEETVEEPAAATPEPSVEPRATPKPRSQPTPRSRPPTSRATPKPAPVAATSSEAVEHGMLHLSARPRCKVTIGDKSYGTTDETRRGVNLAPGTYTVRFVCDDESECAGFKRKAGKKTLTVRAGEKTTYVADFYKLNARLK